jgi:NADH-quinone oxidoreductase subunit C
MLALRKNYIFFNYITEFLIKNEEDQIRDFCNNFQENIINNEKIFFFYLYDSLALKIFTELCCVDYLGKNKKNRFVLNYCFLSVKHNRRIIRKIKFNEYTELFSLASFMKSANWLEREVYDLFGIKFLEHPDLRRILTDYGFIGTPLRKDFPLIGYKEVAYNEQKGSVVYTKISFNQEYRNLDVLSPWNNKHQPIIPQVIYSFYNKDKN